MRYGLRTTLLCKLQVLKAQHAEVLHVAQVYSRQQGGNVDSRYYAAKRDIPFGIDPNKMSDSFLGNFMK